jgi:hypothetical protein
MKRPECKTCPYWYEDGWKHYSYDPWGNPTLGSDNMPNEEAFFGLCMRRAPQPKLVKETQTDRPLVPEYAATCSGDWCGEHPDFPAYIASLKPLPIPACSS